MSRGRRPVKAIDEAVGITRQARVCGAGNR